MLLRRQALKLFAAVAHARVAAAATPIPSVQPVWLPEEGRALIGTKAPAWKGLVWLDGGPLDLGRLHGRPVFVRFWTNDCPFCHDSAPALIALAERYTTQGLQVVGVHHPKSRRTHDEIRTAAQRLGFHFPIATDPDWTTVRAYGVGTTFRRYTSVSFLIDRCGVIRFVHDGGTIPPAGPAHAALVAAVEASLAAKACRAG